MSPQEHAAWLALIAIAVDLGTLERRDAKRRAVLRMKSRDAA